MSEHPGSTSFLSTEDILAIHELVVEANEDTEPGVSSRGGVEFAVEYVQEGHFGNAPETLHEQAYQLLRLIVANHPFVDGNKRTALMSTRVFYALNGLEFDYDREFKAMLKKIATDEATVDSDAVLSYLREHTEPLAPEYEATIHLWTLYIEAGEQLRQEFSIDSDDDGNGEPNHYGESPHNGE